eukprot:gene3527-2010_t
MHKRGKSEKQKKFLMCKEKQGFDPRHQGAQEVIAEDIAAFFANIKQVLPTAVVNHTFAHAPEKDVPPSLLEIVSNIVKNSTKDPDQILETFLAKLSFNDDQLRELEKVTKSQSSSRDWYKQRKGRITASKFHDVHSKMQALSRKGKACRVTLLILAIVEPKILLSVPSLELGKQNEKNAAEAFMQQEGKHHENAKFIPCGLYLYKPHPYIGATPDNIFSANAVVQVQVKYKCQFTIKEEDIQTSWNKINFLVKVYETIKLKRSHKYSDHRANGSEWTKADILHCIHKEKYF